jgi:hypothetical protein
MTEKTLMSDKIGMYVLGGVAIIAFVVLVIYGDPIAAKEWIPVVGTLATVFVGLQVRSASTKQLAATETVHKAVNSTNIAALEVSTDAAEARGRLATLADLEPIIERAAAKAVAADRAANATDPPAEG